MAGEDPKTATPLLTLPLELRTCIFDFVLRLQPALLVTLEPKFRVILPPLGLANRQIMHEMQDLLRKRSVMGILPHITLCATNRFPADLRVVVKHLNKRLDRYIPSTHPPPVKRHVTLSFHLNNDFMQCSEHELQHLCSMQALTSGKFKCLSVKVTWPSNFRVRNCKTYLNRYSRQFGNGSPRKAPQQWKVFVEAFDAKTRARIPDQHPPLKERAKDLLRREAAQLRERSENNPSLPTSSHFPDNMRDPLSTFTTGNRPTSPSPSPSSLQPGSHDGLNVVLAPLQLLALVGRDVESGCH